jgi:hypothetical protein
VAASACFSDVSEIKLVFSILPHRPVAAERNIEALAVPGEEKVKAPLRKHIELGVADLGKPIRIGLGIRGTVRRDRDEPTAQYGSSPDSPLEGDGFEPPVPRAISLRLRGEIRDAELSG